MELTQQLVREVLGSIADEGWNSARGRKLLECIRQEVVRPVVRGSGLRGPAADQAEASAWEAAWDALRRPSALTADNPRGMAWAAARRAVWAEQRHERTVRSASDTEAAGVRPVHPVSLDRLVAAGWQPPTMPSPPGPSALEARLVSELAGVGWDPVDAADAIAIMSEQLSRRGSGAVATRWRWVAARLDVPAWQARRLADLLLGSAEVAGVVELVARCGLRVLEDPAVVAAFRSTRSRWAAGPTAWLACVDDGCVVALTEQRASA